MQTVWFVDTSILCNLLPVPGRDSQQDRVRQEMMDKARAGHTFILPVTTVIETGNHVSQIKNGADRRTTGQKFSQLLTLVVEERAPWRLHEFSWGRETLRALISGASTGQPLAGNLMSGLGCGDLCILAEREFYRQRAKLREVKIWAIDAQLAAHS